VLTKVRRVRWARSQKSVAAAAHFAFWWAPAGSSALEPRFDHRDERGLIVEAGASRATYTVEKRTYRCFNATSRCRRSETQYAPDFRVGYTFDVSGVGDELVLGLTARAGGWRAEGEAASAALDARYRNFFGTEHLKTMIEVGLAAPAYPRIAVGPVLSGGVLYDFSRTLGIYGNATFSAVFGAHLQALSFGLSAGFQTRW
jgi:hypothetical protein